MGRNDFDLGRNDLGRNGLGAKRPVSTGVAEGTNPNDAVNKAQWDAYNSYYYYTDDLKHNNQKNVNFPNFNKYPFMSDTTEIINIQLNGYYHIIFTDYYKGNTNKFRIISNTTPIFIKEFDSKSDWTPLFINTVCHFNSGDYIQIDFRTNSSRLCGIKHSTFYIKYLHT